MQRLNAILWKVLLFCAFGLMSDAQVLEETASFSKTERGEAVFKLNEGESIYTYKSDGNGWYKARKRVFIQAVDLGDGKNISQGTTLYNEEGNKIGEVLADMRLKELDTIEAGFRKDAQFVGIVEGYIFKTKIKDGTIPELRLSEILAIKNRTEQQEKFGQFWDENQAEEEERGSWLVKVIYQPNSTASPESDFRLIVVFRGGSTPFAVISNNQEVELQKVKDTWDDGGITFQVFSRATDAQRQDLEDLMYSYLKL